MAIFISHCRKLQIGCKWLLSTNGKHLTVSATARRNFTEQPSTSTDASSQWEESRGTSLLHFRGEWTSANQIKFRNDMKVLVNFLTEDEESKILDEIEPYMKRLRYEFDHWDDAIHGFRETERTHWYPHNREVLERVRRVGFQEEIMPYIHILDLAEDGVIKPHIDSVRYCGHTIAGISLLSDAVMRLVYATTKDDPSSSEDYRSQPKAILENNFYADIFLPRRSLYIMSHYARYDFTHEILSSQQSMFMGKPIKKGRRISIICRNEP